MTTRTRLDLFKRYRNEYVAPKEPRLIHIEPAQYIAIATNPPPEDFDRDAPEQALYIVTSALRIVTAAAHQREFVFCKLEWLLCDPDLADDLAGPYAQVETQPPNQPSQPFLLCKVMMRVPDFVTQQDLTDAVNSLLERSWDKPTSLWIRRAHLEQLSEGLCVQMRHAGCMDLDSQARTLAVLREFAQTNGLETAGPPHAICLASSRHVPPEHLRTLLRFPVRLAPVATPVATELVPA